MNPLILCLPTVALVVAVAYFVVYLSSSVAERVEPVASKRLAWASAKASVRVTAAVLREASAVLRLVF